MSSYSSGGLPAAWTNVRVAKTANYTVLNSDKGSTFALGGSSTFTLTLNAASGYDSNFAIVVVNEDTANAKKMAINGLTTFFLWPGQTIFIYNDNSAWKSTGPYRWLLSAATTFFVNHGTGSNSNDGLTSGNALATIAQAVANLQAFIDLGGTNPIIQVANETFTENLTILNGFTGGHEITIQGNNASPTSCVWQCNSGANLSVRDMTIIELSGFKMTTTGSQCVIATQSAVVDFSNMEFGTATGATHFQCDSGAVINDNGGTYVVSGNCIFHWQVQNGGRMTIGAGRTISVPNALTFTDWLYCQTGVMSVGSGVTFTGTGSAAGSTGTKYNVNYNGVASIGAVTLPGATAGTTSTGGQVL